jgi:hypothetical protein
MSVEPPNLGTVARRLMRGAATAVLSSRIGPGGWPYGSLVLAACAHDATPILLISSLAEHTRNIADDDRVSLLFDGTGGLDNPLTGPRLTVLGRARPDDSPNSHRVGHRERFLNRHPSAADYVDFGDFAFFRVAVERAHLVAGFGAIHWIDGADLMLDRARATAFAEAERAVRKHMNSDHADAVALYAEKLAGQRGGSWRMVGCDADGVDLRLDVTLGGRLARVDFATPATSPDELRPAMIELARIARR